MMSSLALCQNVSYFEDNVMEIDGKLIKFLGGSMWLADYDLYQLAFNDGIIVFDELAPKIVKKEDLRIESENRRGVFYYEGEKVGVRYLDGFYFRTNAILTTVIESYGEGAVLKTSDGSYWKVPEYDQYDTGWWLPPYDALIQNELYLINLKKGKKVWVSRTD
ncbi:MAG: hypothetical protein HOD28_05245 [Candidatus Marinimicrobia bacterium]|nr:hypothetical protein [Candidatus Neomarinimicrobiota bacterium]MBT4382993.1 hypothetical protein [Candidatus Neomarinimicrobiota bacterium]